jgi:hypothetical protein
MLLFREFTPQRRLLLLARILDLLEQDYHHCHPDEEPPFMSGYEEIIRNLLIPK